MVVKENDLSYYSNDDYVFVIDLSKQIFYYVLWILIMVKMVYDKFSSVILQLAYYYGYYYYIVRHTLHHKDGDRLKNNKNFL